MRYKFTLVRDVEQLDAVLKRFSKDTVYLDTETTGLTFDSLLLCISGYSKKLNEAFVVATDYYFELGIPIIDIIDTFSKYKLGCVMHNGKYDLGVLEKEGFDMSNILLTDDTMVLIHLSDSNLKKNLELRVKEDFGVSKPTFKSIVGKNWDRIDWYKDVVETELESEQKGKFTFYQFCKYASDDVYWTWKLHSFYYAKISEDKDLLKVYENIDMPLIEVLNRMYLDGVNIEVSVLEKMDSVLVKNIEEVEQSIFKQSGVVFNMNSPKQKAEVLYEKLGYPILKETNTGNPSTDRGTLEKLAMKGYPVCVAMQDYSVLNKLYSGYVNGIPNMLDADGRLRGNLNAQGTKTYRFSSDSPNLQNQPNNKAYPVRQAFIPTEGYQMAVADYSQIELRIMAHVAEDPKFIEYFNEGLDPHGMVATDLGITRNQAKIVNFGILYGMSKFGLGYALKLSTTEAQEIIDGFEGTYVGYYQWKKKMTKYLIRNAYGVSMFGRKVKVPGVRNYKFRNSAIRTGINAMIQGPAADVIKVAMINVHKEFQKYDTRPKLLLQVHDELVMEALPEYMPRAFSTMIDLMENSLKLRVPLVAEGVICKNWADMKGGEVPDYLMPKTFETYLHTLIN